MRCALGSGWPVQHDTYGAVCVVLGPHRNRRGTLLERVSADDRAVVQLGGDFQIVECTFEQVAEWTGPAGDGLDDDLVG